MVKSPSDTSKYPHVARWYVHIASYEAEHPNLSGDKSRAATLLASVAGSSSSAPAAADDDDDEVDLFGSDDEEEDAEAERVKAERVAEYNRKKQEKEAVKGKTVHKSVVTLQVKPWDDETDLDALEKGVRAIEQDGLVWGASKRVPVGYGVSMIQITLVVEDEKVSLDELQEKIQEDLEDCEWNRIAMEIDSKLTFDSPYRLPVHRRRCHAEALIAIRNLVHRTFRIRSLCHHIRNIKTALP